METIGTLRAWVETRDAGQFLAAFVGVATAPDGSHVPAGRAPATNVFGSASEARQWVQAEASALDVPVEWVGNGD